jgi:RNA polymerase sigma-70 factor (ECF subfamily)
MSDGVPFSDFVQRVRAGDEQAARELVRRFERAIRCEVRLHLTDASLYRLFDSADVSQAVLASFFARAADGQYRLDSADDLARLLIGMARKKAAHFARTQRAGRRDYRRTLAGGADDVPAAAPAPDDQAAGAELEAEFRHRLSADERRIADLRADGRTWPEVADALGGTPKGREMQWRRAARRLAEKLGLRVATCPNASGPPARAG